MSSTSFRKPLLRRNFSIERLGRKSSINALAPINPKHDSDGMESIDSYFPDEPENSVNQTKSAMWKVGPSPQKPSFPSLPAIDSNPPGTPTMEDYDVPMNDNGEHDSVHEINERLSQTQFVSSPDGDDREIVFKRSIKPRPSSPSSNQQSLRKKASSQRGASKLVRKRSLLTDHLVDVPSDDEANRRSGRKRFAPLAFWKNEKVVYGRRNSARMPVIVDVVKKIEEDGQDKAKRKWRKKTKKEQPKLDAVGIIKDYESKTEVETRTRHCELLTLELALSHSLVQGEPVPNADFSIHTMFVEGGFMSAGVLLFPPDVSKPSRNSAKHSLVFHVIEGRVRVRVHRSEFEVFPGCQFWVPRGNQYSIDNVGKDEARLFFCHCRESGADSEQK